jgi:hypothetical protein
MDAAQAEQAAGLAVGRTSEAGQQRLLQLAVAAGKWVHVLAALPPSARQAQPGEKLAAFTLSVLKLCHFGATHMLERLDPADDGTTLRSADMACAAWFVHLVLSCWQP